MVTTYSYNKLNRLADEMDRFPTPVLRYLRFLCGEFRRVCVPSEAAQPIAKEPVTMTNDR